MTISNLELVANPAPPNSHQQVEEVRIKSLSLPFTIRIARTEDQLLKAVNVRVQTYERHHPSLASILKQPELDDKTSNSLVLLAQSKQDDAALGTLRIETNLTSKIRVEELLRESSRFSRKTIAFVTRLGVRQSSNSQLVKISLFKALHRYCLARQIEWIVVTAKPPMDRQYLKLGFEDVYEATKLLPIPWSDNIETRLLCLNVVQAESQWRAANHPLYEFMIQEYCPDIRIFDSVAGIWGQPRTDSAQDLQLSSIFGRNSDTN